MHRLNNTDVNKAASVLSSAFSGDPLMEYLIEGKSRVVQSAWFFHRFYLEYGMRYGQVFTTSDRIEGVSIWLPPGQTDMTIWKLVRAGILRLPMKLSASFLTTLSIYENFTKALHKKHAPFSHWYLLAVAVDRRFRGKGLGSSLLKPMLASLDCVGFPCYLETHNGVNVDLYRHYGFEVAELGKLPGSEISHWSMLRQPASSRH